jgi:hypothetical protein
VAEIRAGQQSWKTYTASGAFASLNELNRLIYNAQLCEWSLLDPLCSQAWEVTGLKTRQSDAAAPLVLPGADISFHIMLLVGFEAISSVH